MRFTVLTNINGCTVNPICVPSSLVYRTGLISHFIVMEVLVSGQMITSKATLVIIILQTRYQILRGNIDVWPRRFSHNFYSISKGRRGCLSPTGATILRQVLILNVC